MFEVRQFQVDAVKAWNKAINIPGNNPVVALPTAAGKSYMMCMLVELYLYENPDSEVLILSHTSNIIEQDAEALEEFFPGKHIAVYSSGLNRKEHNQITVGGIQSVINNKEIFKWTNLVIIDEVHAVNHKNQGRYRTFINSLPHTTISGMSATVYRSGHGYIHKGKGTLFNDLAYDLTSLQNFNKLIEDGYLCKLISVSPKFQLDSSKITKSGGDYNLKQLSNTHDKDSITKKVVDEAVLYGRKYKKWLVFAIDIEHAEHINKQLNLCGVPSSVLHSRMKQDKQEVVKEFVKGDSRALVSVGMITTGFNAPNVDLILILRPTASVVLHVQMIGRGLRVSDNKEHCLVLDYCGNIERLGPVNDPIIPKSGRETKGQGEAPTKVCPECRTINPASSKYCESCNYTFTFKTKLTTSISDKPVIKEKVKPANKWLTVTDVKYSIHKKAGSKDSLLISYICGIKVIKEWLCIEHQGYAGDVARFKARMRGYKGYPDTVELFNNTNQLKIPKRILVDFSSKYPQAENMQYV